MNDTVAKTTIKSGISIMKNTIALEGITFVFQGDQEKAKYAQSVIEMLVAFESDLDAM